MPTPPPSPPGQSPKLTPATAARATSDPHLFVLEARPQSLTRVDVYVSGRYNLSTQAPLAGPTPSPSPRATPPSLPAPSPTPTLPWVPPPLNEANATTAVEVSVANALGRIVAVGRTSDTASEGGTFQRLSFLLDHPLPADPEPYVVTARWRTAPDVSTVSRLAIADVSGGAGTRIGDAFIEADFGTPYFPATIFRVIRSRVGREGRVRTIASQTKPRATFELADGDDGRGLGPMITDGAVNLLRQKYFGQRAETNDYKFGCVNALDEGAEAELLAGSSFRIDTIARAAHVMRWLPDEPRMAVYSHPCNGDCSKNSGVFVDSPLVVGFSIDPVDVRIIPPMVTTRPYIFHGNCIRGFAVLQNERQFSDVFALAKRTP